MESLRTGSISIAGAPGHVLLLCVQLLNTMMSFGAVVCVVVVVVLCSVLSCFLFSVFLWRGVSNGREGAESNY